PSNVIGITNRTFRPAVRPLLLNREQFAPHKEAVNSGGRRMNAPCALAVKTVAHPHRELVMLTYFDRVLDAAFKPVDGGYVLIMPNGWLIGRGRYYRVNEEQKATLMDALRRLTTINNWIGSALVLAMMLPQIPPFAGRVNPEIGLLPAIGIVIAFMI